MAFRLLLLLPCLPVLLTLACEADGPRLDGRVFLSQSVTENGARRPLVGTTQLLLQFYEEPSFRASADCNTLSGPYSLDGDRFVLSEAGRTLVACSEERHAQDDWYFGFLFSSPTLALDGDTLVLEGDGTRIEYLDQEAATPDAALVGPTWTVETVIEGDTAMATEWSSPATLVLSDDGAVTVSTGCNSGSGTHRVNGKEITFSDVAVTERGCEGDTADLERAVLGVIHGPQPVAWEITGVRLSLRGADFGLDLVASDG